MTSYDFSVKLVRHPLLSHFVTTCWHPVPKLSQNYHLPPQATRKRIVYRKQLPLFTAKTLTSPYYCTNANHHTKQRAYWKPLRQAVSAHPSKAGELPDCSIWSLASSAQNRIGCCKNSWRHDISNPSPPPLTPSSHIVMKVSTPSLLLERDFIYGRPLITARNAVS